VAAGSLRTFTSVESRWAGRRRPERRGRSAHPAGDWPMTRYGSIQGAGVVWSTVLEWESDLEMSLQRCRQRNRERCKEARLQGGASEKAETWKVGERDYIKRLIGFVANMKSGESLL